MMRWTEEQKSLCQITRRVQQMILPALTHHHTNQMKSMMNLARIHDKYTLKKFWELKIENHIEKTGNEDSRMKSSALSKLREEWIHRLQIRHQHLTESRREDQMRKAKSVQAILTA